MSLWNLFGNVSLIKSQVFIPITILQNNTKILSLVLGEYEDWVLLVQGKNMIMDDEFQ